MLHFENKRVLITGINGFIGSHLKEFLINEKNCKNVYGIDISNNNNVFSIDIAKNPLELRKIIAEIKPQIVFHLAANIKPSRELDDFDDIFRTNVIGTINLLSAIKYENIDLDCFVNLGSCEEYGSNEQPFYEEQTPNPISIYSGTKAASAMLCKMFYNLYQIPIVTARPSLVYGAGQKDRFFIIEAIKKLIMGEDLNMTLGEQTRDFIYIDDLVKALVEICNAKSLIGETVNISSGIDYKLKDVVLTIAKLSNSKSKIKFGAVPYRQNEIMRYSCSNKKITTLTNWKPNTSLEEGLDITIKSLI